MRRTLALVASACTAVVLAGATAYAMTGDGTEAQPAGIARLGQAAAAPPAAAAAEQGKESDTAAGGLPVAPPAGVGAAIDAVGRQKVGALESVGALLDYRSAGTTTETFRYPGAEYVKVHFDELAMLPGDYVTVSDPEGTEVHRVDSDPLDVVGGLLGSRAEAADGAGRWAMSVTGDTAVVTLHRAVPDPLGLQEAAGLGVRVDKVARGFTGQEQAAEDASELRTARSLSENGREESVCGSNEARDAVCYKSADPVAYKKSKAVARLLINGTELCTGWRLGTTNRMLTNNHCMVTSSDAYDTEVWFDYQCAKCGGDAVFKATKVWGDKVLSTDRDLDYTLFSVENFAQVQKYGYLTIEPTRPVKGSEVYIPQHPGGNPGMIAMGSDKDGGGICAVNDPAYDGYGTDSDVSYYCDTAGGSSGSPVISRKTDRVIALHHFGGCPNSGVRIDLVYNRIKKLL
ncbi:serine protease [Asanoa sp. NPDC049573]|uniref:trypsin-like serine peptidase n=1 Tax=Asanoa sp. NPDC049573 TaxID=3155396 RepID=UPI0034179391